MHYRFSLDGRNHTVQLEEHASGPRFIVDGTPMQAQVDRLGKGHYRVKVDEEAFEFRIEGGIVHEGVQALDLEVRRGKPTLQRAGGAARRIDGRVKPPMPGTVVEVRVEQGAQVEEGQVLCVLEAMKMQNDIKAPIAGTVGKVHVRPGQNVESSTVLVEVVPRPA